MSRVQRLIITKLLERICLVVFGILFAVTSVAGSVTHVAWIGPTGMGGNGNWSTAADWSGGVVPNNGGGITYAVLLPQSCGFFCRVTFDISPTIDSLTTQPGAWLNSPLTAPRPTETLTTGSITNAGIIVVDAVKATGTISNISKSGEYAAGETTAEDYVQTGGQGLLPAHAT
jgi:hypothetical protein